MIRKLAISFSILFVPFALISARSAQSAEFHPIPFDVIREAVNVVLTVHDGHAMQEFYGVVLGLRQIPTLEMPDGSTMLRYLGGRAEIKLWVAPSEVSKVPGGFKTGRGIRGMTVYLPESRGVLDRLEEHGMTLQDRQEDDDGVTTGKLSDPEGNVVELKIYPDGTDIEVFNNFGLQLIVESVHESRLYYGQMLRIKELVPIPGEDYDDPTTYRFQAGNTTINISSYDEPLPAYVGPPGEAAGMRTLQFLVNDSDAVHDVLKTRGADVVDLFTMDGIARVLYLRDPDGIYVEFMSPPANL